MLCSGRVSPSFRFIPIPMRSLLILPCAVLMTSCMLGPEPGSPEVVIPASFRSDTAPHGTSFGDRSWRKVFSDPTLRNLISRALKNNPDLVAATYRIEEARALAESSRANWFPRLDGDAGAFANYASRNSAPVNKRHSESYNLTGLLSWELDLWGGIARDNQAARSRLLQAEFQRDAVQTSLIASVVTAYIDLQNLDERLGIAQRTAQSRGDRWISSRHGGTAESAPIWKWVRRMPCSRKPKSSSQPPSVPSRKRRTSSAPCLANIPAASPAAAAWTG